MMSGRPQGTRRFVTFTANVPGPRSMLAEGEMLAALDRALWGALHQAHRLLYWGSARRVCRSHELNVCSSQGRSR